MFTLPFHNKMPRRPRQNQIPPSPLPPPLPPPAILRRSSGRRKMAAIRPKRVTDPLNSRVRDRLRGVTLNYASSGSEHAGEISRFSDLLHSFLEPPDAADELSVDFSGEDSDHFAADHATNLRRLLDPSLHPDSFRFRLKSAVESEPGIHRTVMNRLREKGFDAGICKARWGSAGGLIAGKYEYIDVIDNESGGRYIVDLGFGAEFAVARATEEYGMVAGVLPAIAVARPEEVREAVEIMAEAVRRSMRISGLSLPPWRKRKYMVVKWLGPYLRTVNLVPAIAGVEDGGEIKCRMVGFGAGRIAGTLAGG